MPFNPPFKKEFEKGDLIYGCGPARWEYQSEKLGNFPSYKSIMDGEIIYIDHYAGYMQEISPDGKELLVYKPGCRTRKLPDDQNEFTSTILSHQKYKNIWDDDDIINSLSRDQIQSWGRKSKAGIIFISNSPNNRTIHFILDLLDMKDVVKKTTMHMSSIGPDDFKPITGSELRWIYRNRHNPKVQKSIQFWLNGRPTPPPWAGIGAELWKQYIPRFNPEWVKYRSRSAPKSFNYVTET